MVAPGGEERVGAHHKRTGPLIDDGLERGVDLAFVTGSLDMKPEPK
jgi:hypothetical protein